MNARMVITYVVMPAATLLVLTSAFASQDSSYNQMGILVKVRFVFVIAFYVYSKLLFKEP